jgi:hypothetical protein
MIGINEYTALDHDSRAEMVWNLGAQIALWKGKEFSYFLYYLESFYVEVVVDTTVHKITEVTPFKNGVRLDKYANKVDLKVLMN